MRGENSLWIQLVELSSPHWQQKYVMRGQTAAGHKKREGKPKERERVQVEYSQVCTRGKNGHLHGY